MAKLSIDMLNQMGSQAFVTLLKDVWERAPWVAQAVAPLRPFESAEALHAAMLDQVTALQYPQLLDFLNHHPDLAGVEAKQGTMTAYSTQEQGALSLEMLQTEEAATWDELNKQHRVQFGYPFILCVRRHDRSTALAELQSRLRASADAELATTLEEIGWISRLRLADLMSDN